MFEVSFLFRFFRHKNFNYLQFFFYSHRKETTQHPVRRLRQRLKLLTQTWLLTADDQRTSSLQHQVMRSSVSHLLCPRRQTAHRRGRGAKTKTRTCCRTAMSSPGLDKLLPTCCGGCRRSAGTRPCSTSTKFCWSSRTPEHLFVTVNIIYTLTFLLLFLMHFLFRHVTLSRLL